MWKKIHQFLSSIKKTHTKENRFLFSASRWTLWIDQRSVSQPVCCVVLCGLNASHQQSVNRPRLSRLQLSAPTPDHRRRRAPRTAAGRALRRRSRRRRRAAGRGRRRRRPGAARQPARRADSRLQPAAAEARPRSTGWTTTEHDVQNVRQHPNSAPRNAMAQSTSRDFNVHHQSIASLNGSKPSPVVACEVKETSWLCAHCTYWDYGRIIKDFGNHRHFCLGVLPKIVCFGSDRRRIR